MVRGRGRRASVGCAEARDALADDGQDPERAARIARHRMTCAACQLQARRLGHIENAVTTTAAPLDDLTRARMGAAIAARMADAGARAGERIARRPVWVTGFAVGALAVATFLLISSNVLWWPSRRPFQAPVAAPPVATTPVIRPDTNAGAAFTHLEVPAGAKVRARLADHARVTVVGPAKIEVLGTSGDTIELGLPFGTLLGDYDHQSGGTLRIRSPRLVTEIVGTLFAVEASATGRDRKSVV